MNSRRIAQALIGLTAILILAGATATPVPGAPEYSDFRDWQLWSGVIDGMRGGEGYYEVTNRLLREHQYVLRPFFVWRLPTLATVSSILGRRAMRAILTGLACVVAWAWIWEFCRQFGGWGVLGAPLALFWIGVAHYVEYAWLFHDTWVGLLLALSLWLHSRNRWACMGVAVIALLIREHSALYVLVMLAFTVQQRCRRETLGWLGCLAVFGAYMLFHAYMHAQYVVSGACRPYSPSAGWPLLVLSTEWTLPGYLGAWWLKAAVIPVALLGAVRSPRLFWVLGTYLYVFMFTAGSGNWYWGLIYAPLLAVGLVYSVPVVAQLISCASGRSITTSPPVS